MDSKIDKPTPSKSVHNILREKCPQGKIPYGYNCASPFKLLPAVSTPPSSRVVTIKNPFDTNLADRLHLSVFSPSVFNKENVKTEENFRWAIEDISALKPADIDEDTVQQFESPYADLELEETAQANIEKFFSEKHIVPSPFDNIVKNMPLIRDNLSPVKLDLKVTAEASAQTILSLPPNLPKHVEDILRPYFSYTVDQQERQEGNNSALYHQLFDFNEPSPSSVHSSPAPSCNLQPSDFVTSPHNNNPISDCNLSPIAYHLSQIRGGRLESMSVDNSYNFVPDTLHQVSITNQSMVLESDASPPQETLSNSSINWDLEYGHVSFKSPNANEDEMDVSNSNTPKSRIFVSQRKKLSDSFLKEDEEDMKENFVEYRTDKSGGSATQNDITDAGYHTASGLTMSEEWNSSHVFASTPTKSNHYN